MLYYVRFIENWNGGLTAKTEFVHFNKQGIEPGTTTIEVMNQSIEFTDAVKFLDIHFDYKLTFNKHISHVLQKISKTLNMVKFLRGVLGFRPF